MAALKTKIPVILVVILLVTGIFAYIPLSAAADDGKEVIKVVDSVKIEEGDSLWSIASRYYSDDCKGMKQYINEIKETNHLSSDTLHTGGYLIVPYYVDREE